MDAINHVLEWAFGTGGSSIHINAPQMALRAIVVYVATVLIVRLGKKRFMSRATAFDVILAIMLGSLVSRAIAGSAPFVPTLVASAVLLALHWLFWPWQCAGTASGWPSRAARASSSRMVGSTRRRCAPPI